MSLFSAISVSATGMSVQRTRAEVLAQNLANADTTRTQEGGPYKRRDVVFESVDAGASFGSLLDEAGSGLTTVKVSEIRVDQQEGPKRYMPGHPDANADGYVAMPRINPAEDMVDLMGSSRGYQANVAAISAVKDMIQRSIDLFR
ncbi:MAG: flagellar basal body rod protein FlgC [Bryobacteraceae bacterium]|nr:flagellar basal body rod protein FlgC [Bryobacteraceae bacterium]